MPAPKKSKKERRKNMWVSELPKRGTTWITISQYADLVNKGYRTILNLAMLGRIPSQFKLVKGKEVLHVNKAEVDVVYRPSMSHKAETRTSARWGRKPNASGFRNEDGTVQVPTSIQAKLNTDDDKARAVQEAKVQSSPIQDDDNPFIENSPQEVLTKSKALKEHYLAKKEKAQYEITISKLVDYQLLLDQLSSLFVEVRENLLSITDRIGNAIGQEASDLVNDEIRDTLDSLSSVEFASKLEKIVKS